MKADGRTDSPAETALALLDRWNPLPAWSTAVYGPVRPDLAPDHSSVLGMESDLLHLLEVLRQSPNCALLDGGREDAPLPARMEPRWLARPADLEYVLEYVPSPRDLAPPVPWRPMVQAAHLSAAVENVPAAGRQELAQNGASAAGDSEFPLRMEARRRALCAFQRWPERGVALPRTPETGRENVVALSPRAERLFRLWVRPDRRPAAPWNAPSATPAAPCSADVRLPSELRGFHENGILSRPHVVQHARKSSVPGWMVSLFTALVILLVSTWVLQKSTFADRFMLAHAEASSPSDAALGAFPTMSKYVEVTGVRVSADTKTSEIRYVVVNHSAAELPPLLLTVKIRPKRGSAAVCSFTATVQGLGPNESREMQTTVPRELHSYELPEWRDLRVEAHVTAKQ